MYLWEQIYRLTTRYATKTTTIIVLQTISICNHPSYNKPIYFQDTYIAKVAHLCYNR